jgi:hypothetical protein
MYKYEVTMIGQFHTNHNEDSLISSEIGTNKQLIAVMDGCSSAIDSYFSATLTAKLLRKIAKEEGYKEFVNNNEKTNSELLKDILKQLFQYLFEVKQKIDLEKEELLNTLILGVVHTEKRTAEIIIIGDGLISCNNQLHEYDQDNKPDYLGYHLNKDFEEWFSRQEQKIKLENISDLSIATDGIYTFKKFDNIDNYEIINDIEIINKLLKETTDKDNQNMLKKALYELEKRYGLKPTDDLSIIRMIF